MAVWLLNYVQSHVATFDLQLCKPRDVRCQASASYHRVAPQASTGPKIHLPVILSTLICICHNHPKLSSSALLAFPPLTGSLALDWLRPPVSRASAGAPVSSSPCIASRHALCFGSVRSSCNEPPSPVLLTSPTSRLGRVCVQPPVLPCFRESVAVYVQRSTPSPCRGGQAAPNASRKVTGCPPSTMQPILASLTRYLL